MPWLALEKRASNSPNPTSKPYIALTLELVAHFGCVIKNQDGTRFDFSKATPLRPSTLDIPPDWSAAAYLLVAAALSKGSLELQGLNKNYTQADQNILSILEQAGVQLLVRHALLDKSMAIELIATPVIKAFQCNLEDSPDLFPALAALAAYAHGTSFLTGLHRLVHKESNRAQCIMDTLDLLGISCEEKRKYALHRRQSKHPGRHSNPCPRRSPHRHDGCTSRLALRRRTLYPASRKR